MIIVIVLMLLLVQESRLTLSSPDFEHEGVLPKRFTCDGDDINPTIYIDGIPQGSKSLVVIMEDPDVPTTTFSHWVVWDITPQQVLMEGSVKGVEGSNSLGKNNYLGPCPVTGSHRYFFKVYALDVILGLDKNADKWDLEKAMTSHIVARGEIMGTYRRK